MREIKFLAFHKSNKKIYKVFCIDFQYNEVRLYDLVTKDYFDCRLGYVELIQYTGLKDKNGVEIYEGDIVKPCYEVVWVDFGWYAMDDDFGQGFWLGKKTPVPLEVIGNIYENPEILGGNK